MDEEKFVEYVKSESRRHDTETLREVVQALNDIIMHRVNGKPEGLRVGSIIHAIELGFEDYRLGHTYGVVTRITAKGCLVQEPGASDSRCVWFSKYAIEFIPDHEWTFLSEKVRKDNEETKARADQQMCELYGEDWHELSDEEFEERSALSASPRRTPR